MNGSPGIDPQVIHEIEPEVLSDAIRSIEDDALEQQARLAQAPLPAAHTRRRWLHRGADSGAPSPQRRASTTR